MTTLSQDAEAFRTLPADLYADVLNGRVLAAEAIEIHRSRRREKAEQIARETLALNLASAEDANASDAALMQISYTGARVREMLTAAALAALTEKESAR